MDEEFSDRTTFRYQCGVAERIGDLALIEIITDVNSVSQTYHLRAEVLRLFGLVRRAHV